MADTLLQVRDLHTYFWTEDGLVKAVNGVSFDVRRGETLGIVGESGCGKSATAMSIMRLIPCPPGSIIKGQVIFDGQDLLQLSEAEMLKIRGNRIAMIFQEPMTSLNPVLTIGRQVGEPLELHRGAKIKEALKAAVGLLTKVRIPAAQKRTTDYPHQFSGGMRQRAMIAMGLGCEPGLIIADEPTTALDVTVQAQLLDLMKNLTRDSSVALIIITHNLGVVARYADRVIVMYAGKVIETGTAHDIYEDPRHPYTLGLMASVPKIDQDVKTKLIPIEGQPPDMANLPVGCSFQSRCKYAVEKCRMQVPQLESVGAEHQKACWIDV
ncbi:MAG: ABC transporter ATP-binding protein [Desulfobacteraceae bacterium]|nr:MAG: ABC transporter ATP-binding protein [Desulfobacteraceae bacterium]